MTGTGDPRDVALAEIERLVAGGGDADDVLRGTLGVIGSLYPYAAIGFVEEGEVVVGPALGEANGSDVERVPIVYQSVIVGELATVSTHADRAFLERVAALISAHVLLGWDTGGETWEP